MVGVRCKKKKKNAAPSVSMGTEEDICGNLKTLRTCQHININLQYKLKKMHAQCS